MAGSKPNFNWFSLPNVGNTVFASTASASTSFQSLGTFARPGTIRRMIVDFYCFINASADGNASGRVGIIIVAPQVVAVGSTAMPRPITDGERPWLWNRSFAIGQQLAATEGFQYIPLHLHDDVRGMRKFKEQDVLVCVIENAVGSAINSMQSIRLLEST